MFVRQAANVVELLEFFAARRRAATLAEIADTLGWPRSSTFNLIGTLVAKGYLYEPRARGRYYPSLLWRRAAEAIAEAEPLPEAVERLAHRVALETGETSCIAAPAGICALLVHAVESRKPVRFSPWAGERNPIHASASGRALLAQYSVTERQALYRRINFSSGLSGRLAGPAEIEAELTAAAARGYHVCIGEVTEDVVSVAVGLPVAGFTLALVVAGPAFRCLDKIDDFGRLLTTAVRDCVVVETI